MRLRELNWRVLRLPIVILVAVSFAGLAWVIYTHTWRTHTQQALDQAQAQLRQAQSKAAQVDQEIQTILRYRTPYEQLLAAGTVGPEQRVNWLDALRVANRTSRTLGIQYQLNQQIPSALKLDTPAYQLQQSDMKLQINLLHEEDLLRFLQALDQQQAGLYLLHSCAMQRISSAPFTPRIEARLRADCELAWLSFSDRESTIPSP